MPITYTTDPTTQITSARLTADQIRSARVLGGPRETGGIVEIDLDGEHYWGRLLGQVVNRGGLTLSPIVHPTYDQARRAEIANSYRDATASLIDARIAEIDSRFDPADPT